MFEKTNYQDAPSMTVKSVPENGAGITQPAEIKESRLAPTPTKSDANQLPAIPLSVLSASIVVKGEISAGDEIVIHGTVEGTIAHDMKKVVIGKEGRVQALIHANIVIVEGQVDGNIHGNELVELLDGAKVEGDIYCSSIRVEKGARFNGTIHMAP